LRLVVVPIGLFEWRDVRTDQPSLVLLDARVGVGQVGLAHADGLDLRPVQDDTGLERLVDREVVAGSSVEGDGLFVAHVGSPRVRGRAHGGVGPGRTNAGPDGPALELLTHPQGVRLNGHLLRGGAATRTVDHCTSPPFVPGNRTRTGNRTQEGARGGSRRPDGTHHDGMRYAAISQSPRADAPRKSRALSRTTSSSAGVPAGISTTT